jgi:tol-pal system protein YbgF
MMTHKKIKPHMRSLLLGGLLATVPSALFAEDVDQLTQLMSRMSALEAENRELRGRVEEAEHQMAQVSQRMDTMSADVDFRLNNPENGAMPLPLPPSTPPAPSEEQNLALSTSGSDQDYEKARTLLEQGDYEAAERAFAAFVAAHSKDKLAGAAQYWLGVTYFVRGDHERAVAAFAKGYKNYPKSSKAPDNLLKLAKSLGALDRKADACTTLEQLTAEYPNASVKEVAAERKKLNCK